MAKVFVFTKLFYPEGSGGELATYLIIKDILSKYFNITIISGTSKYAKDVLRCCEYVYWPTLKTKYKPLEWIKLFLNTNFVKRSLERADVVYLPFHTLLPLVIVIKKLRHDIKTIVHLHNYQPLTYTSVMLYNTNSTLVNDLAIELYEHSNLAKAFITGFLDAININKINAIALHHADVIICVSRRQAKIITKHMPELISKLKVVYNPLPNIPFIKKRLMEPTFLYVGGDSYIKGFYQLLRVSQKILKWHSNGKFIIAGNLRSSSISTLKKLNKKLHIIFKPTGYIPYEKILELHSGSYALIFPSIVEEPLPYAISEAMLLGTLPLASKVGGVPEIVEGTPAEKFLFTPNSVDELVDKIEAVLSMSREKLINIGLKLREQALKKFDIRRIEKGFLEIFQS